MMPYAFYSLLMIFVLLLVYGYARQFAKVGIVDAFVDSLHSDLEIGSWKLPAHPTGVMWLQNEICRSIADNVGINVVLQCIDDSGEQLNKSIARPCCSLLLKGEYEKKKVDCKEKGVDKDPNEVYFEVVGGKKKGLVLGLGSSGDLWYKKSDERASKSSSIHTPLLLSDLSTQFQQSQVKANEKMVELEHEQASI